MRYRLSTLVSALLLGLCLAAAGLWVRSYFVCDAIDWSTASGRAGVFSLPGRFGVGHVKVPTASLSRILRGVSYRVQPSGLASANELKPVWTSPRSAVSIPAPPLQMERDFSCKDS